MVVNEPLHHRMAAKQAIQTSGHCGKSFAGVRILCRHDTTKDSKYHVDPVLFTILSQRSQTTVS